MLEVVSQQTQQLEAFRADVAMGLSRGQKTLPSRWLYDNHGCELFEKITRLDEYYLTYTETDILREHAREIADFCGEGAVLLEYGAGAGIKTEILIDALDRPRLYVPIDIAGDFLDVTVVRMRERFPNLQTLPVVADFTCDFDIPRGVPRAHRSAFFPGSTMGNLDPHEAAQFLGRVRRHVGWRGTAIIGVDLKKDVATLLAAYDDREGITAAFNLNLLNSDQSRTWRGFLPGILRPPGAMERSRISHRDASGEPSRAGGRDRRSALRLQRWRNDSHRELSKILRKQLHGARRGWPLGRERNLERLRSPLRSVRHQRDLVRAIRSMPSEWPRRQR